MAPWPILAHGEIELNNCPAVSPQVDQAPESRQQAVAQPLFGTHGSPAPKRACRHDCRHGRLRVCATAMAEAKVRSAGSSSPEIVEQAKSVLVRFIKPPAPRGVSDFDSDIRGSR